ncbi:MAG: hypothetical protein IJX14_11130, partial [Clostridia bacterium]|nr:hypothetical protein [Clostridia bacterium]
RKAARILADAETAAAGILKKAEEEAEEILHRRQEEEESALLETGRKIAERNNAADRIVEEIDSFREEVFAMYAKHIEELERLAKITDAFYQTKEELADSAVSDAAEASEAEIPADDAVDADGQDDAVYMSLEDATDSEEWDDPDGVYAETVEEPESDMLRIDWKKHRANRDAADAAEAEEMAAKTLWEIADEAVERIDPDEAPEEDMPDAQEEEYEDGYAAYASCGDETETAPDDFALLTGEEYEENDEDPAGAPADSSTEISEEDFLSDIASEYITPSRQTGASRQHTTVQHEPAAVPAAKPKNAKEAADLDELFTDEETRNVGLTGEFDIIFNSKKSAANVTEISRQPLVAAAKPDKPKKHSTK